MNLGDLLLERIENASLAELAQAEFLALDDSPAAPGDAERVARGLERALSRKNQFAASEPELVRAMHDAIG